MSSQNVVVTLFVTQPRREPSLAPLEVTALAALIVRVRIEAEGFCHAHIDQTCG